MQEAESQAFVHSCLISVQTYPVHSLDSSYILFENLDTTLFVDGSHLKSETGDYEAG